MKYVTGTLEEMTQLENYIFIFGAPFRCTFFNNATYDEESKSVIGSKINGTRTCKLLSPQPIEEGSEIYAILHIDEMNFAPTTFAEYIVDYPRDEEGQIIQEELTVQQSVLLSRIPEDEQYIDYTPQQYVSEVIIDGLYNVIEVEA